MYAVFAAANDDDRDDEANAQDDGDRDTAHDRNREYRVVGRRRQRRRRRRRLDWSAEVVAPTVPAPPTTAGMVAVCLALTR